MGLSSRLLLILLMVLMGEWGGLLLCRHHLRSLSGLCRNHELWLSVPETDSHELRLEVKSVNLSCEKSSTVSRQRRIATQKVIKFSRNLAENLL